MPSVNTGTAIRRAILDELYPLDTWRYGSLAHTAITTTTLTEPRLAYTMLHPQRFIGAWLYHQNGASTDITRITQYNHTTGAFTLAPAITDPTSGTSNYEIHYELAPDEFLSALSAVHQSIYVPEIAPLSESFDESSAEFDGIGQWVNEADAVISVTQNILAENQRRALGRYRISFTTDTGATASQVATPAISVKPLKNYLISIPISAEPGPDPLAATISLINADTNVQIKALSVPFYAEAGSYRPGWYEARWIQTIPADCDAVKVRVQGDNNFSVILLNHASILEIESESFVSPVNVQNPHDILAVMELPVGDSVVGFPDVYHYYTEELVKRAFHTNDHREGRWSEIVVPDGVSFSPLYVEFLRSLGPFTVDTQSTIADLDVLVYGTLARLYKKMGRASDARQAASVFDQLLTRRMNIPPVYIRESATERIYIT